MWPPGVARQLQAPVHPCRLATSYISGSNRASLARGLQIHNLLYTQPTQMKLLGSVTTGGERYGRTNTPFILHLAPSTSDPTLQDANSTLTPPSLALNLKSETHNPIRWSCSEAWPAGASGAGEPSPPTPNPSPLATTLKP